MIEPTNLLNPTTWTTDPAYAEGLAWVIHETNVLNAGGLDEWLTMLSPALQYTMPATVSAHTHDMGHYPAGGNAHFEESYESIRVRIARLASATQWAEDPPSRARRFVTNVELLDGDDDEVRLLSSILLFRSRGESPAFDLLSAGRQDRLVRDDGRLLLAERTITLDHETLGVRNITSFL